MSSDRFAGAHPGTAPGGLWSPRAVEKTEIGRTENAVAQQDNQMDLLNWNWSEFLSHVLKLAGAFVLALPIALERERTTRTLGLRTFPLVALASCGYILVGESVVGTAQDAQARIISGLMTGIGFIGGGAILKTSTGVRGTATAASLWSTGAIGASVAHGLYEIAVLISTINFLTLQFLTPIERRMGKKDRPDLEDS
jgi:putative Mg2+ transporter-C (MgtC) family protein